MRENSLTALGQCVTLGADVMETEVRITRDGFLVMIHIATVHRTTNGHGRVSDLTQAEPEKLRLHQDLGGAGDPFTDDCVATLDYMLRAPAGLIVLNFDIEDAVHAETVEAAARAGALKRVMIEANAGIASPPMARLPRFDRVPFMPMLTTGGERPFVIDRQTAGAVRSLCQGGPRKPLTAAGTGSRCACREGPCVGEQAMGRVCRGGRWKR